MSRHRFALHWDVGRHATAEETPTAWLPAAVPGAVQLDWSRAHGLPDVTVGDAVKREWADLDLSWWTYRARVDEEMAEAVRSGERVFLVLEGVDYACDVRLDGQRLATHEGAQTAIELDVTGRLRGGSVLTVGLHPAPKSHATPADRSQANHSGKAAVAYGWDFHPRLIPLGLWRSAYLETRAAVHFARRPAVDYRLAAGDTAVAGGLSVMLSMPATEALTLHWTLRTPGGGVAGVQERRVAAGETGVTVPFSLEQPELWWPYDQGAPALYTSEVELVDAGGRRLDRAEARVGFRRVRLVMAPDQWKEPAAFPKSRSLPPMTLEVNGRALFVKGSNWVCPDLFPGTLTAERYAEQLGLVRGSNLSLLRVWGGAMAPHDAFYEQCDALGIMVWQEFPLACNAYPDDADYLAVLDRESRSLIERLRGHASLVLWCGGNELFNFWSGMTDQSLALRLLNRNCYDLDPSRPFLATAPVEGMGHGHYVFRDPISGDEGWAIFQRARCTAYTEFGCPAPASVATLRRILPAGEVWPPRAGTSWETHHAFGAWLPSSHLYLEEIEHYFGPTATLEELVERGQLLQGAGLQGLFEEARRQKPGASFALNWCFNEPWPGAANTSLVTWPCEPKPGLTLVAAACRPTLASARLRKFAWSPGETFEAELWLLHDAPVAAEAVEITAWLEFDGSRQAIATWKTGTRTPNTNARGPRVERVLPEFSGPRFTLRLEVAGRAEWNSHYTLAKARAEPAAPRAAVVVPTGATNF